MIGGHLGQDDPDTIGVLDPGLSFTLSGDERLELDRELYRRHERQQYGIPLRNHATVPAGESVTGWAVEAVARKAAGGTPSCTVVIRDELGKSTRLRYPSQSDRPTGRQGLDRDRASPLRIECFQFVEQAPSEGSGGYASRSQTAPVGASGGTQIELLYGTVCLMISL